MNPSTHLSGFSDELDPSSSSKFTYRHFHLLRNFSPRTPLRVIAHIDLDAFYAQCEMVRLGVARDQPLAVQQWDSLIAVNYPARPFEVSRMISAKEAKKLCPQLLTPHVATWREGEGENWAYREEGDNNIATDKVSLDPYRTESRKIQGLMKAELVKWAEGIDVSCRGGVKSRVRDAVDMVRLEKAGTDEVFVDLSALVFGTLMQRYPMLGDADKMVEANRERMATNLPKAPTTALVWGENDAVVDLDNDESEEDDPDWDDLVMLVGSEIVNSIRMAVWEKLKYTCSAGIARNKTVAKLGSACNKPNKQTVVRNRAVQHFLNGYKFTKIRMLGGKLGEHISSVFEAEKVADILPIPLEQLKSKLDDDTGTWLYDLIRGNDHSEVKLNSETKSMLSAKSFRPSIRSVEQGDKWLRIFVADIYGRLVEEGIIEQYRRPKVITIHYRHAGQTKSRQVPIPSGRTIDQANLFDLAKTILRQIAGESTIWPCSNLSLTVSGFEAATLGNQSLHGFFASGNSIGGGNTSKAPSHPSKISYETSDIATGAHQDKRRKVGEKYERDFWHAAGFALERVDNEIWDDRAKDAPRTESPTTSSLYSCQHCGKSVSEFERLEHEDWHLAKRLAEEERTMQRNTARTSKSTLKRQSKLPFG
ncbi:DNA-directed DNA polymerase eta rad30 [Myotisia sp. PD_48]|nr:DNA-directed DNA polymerase eta rad30 [Myotisia sp. PD_48]